MPTPTPIARAFMAALALAITLAMLGWIALEARPLAAAAEAATTIET